MKNAITSEFLKLRRSRVLLLAAVANALPPAVKCIRAVTGGTGKTNWENFLTAGQELTVFSMLITVILLSAYLFTMEYQHGTAAAIFTTNSGRTAIYGAKMVVLAAVITALFMISAVSQLIFGALAAGQVPPAGLLLRFLAVTAWYAASYFLLAAVVALPAVLTKRFVPTAVITLGYYILIFPFHTKNLYVCPFMTPSIIAARLYGSTGYVFSFTYDNMSANMLSAGAFLVILGAAAWVAGATVYRKSDAVR